MTGREGAKLTSGAPDATPALQMADGRVFRMRAIHTPLARLVEELSNPNHGSGGA